MFDLLIENARLCDGTGRPSTMGTESMETLGIRHDLR
jgi:hypothetical protein